MYHTLNLGDVQIEGHEPPILRHTIRARKRSIVTCLPLSRDILVIGLSDGTVHIAEENLRATVESLSSLHDTRDQPDVEVVKFLIGQSSNFDAKVLGAMTNLVCSPISNSVMSVSPWQALATEKKNLEFGHGIK